MSGEHIEIVRRATEAYSRGDVDGLLESWAPDAVLDWSRSRGPEAGVYRGHDQIRAFARRFIATWEDIRIELGDPVALEDGLVVVENVTHVRGRDGIETKARSAWLITFVDGRQASLTLYQSKQDALEAAARS